MTRLNKSNADTQKVLIFSELSNEYLNTDYSQAMEYALKSINLAENISYEKGKALSYRRAGLIFYMQANYRRSLEFYLKSLTINERLGNKTEIAILYNNIGMINFLLRNYIIALDYFSKSLKLCNEINDKLLSINSYYNTGQVYQKMGRLKEALDFYNKSLNLAKTFNDIRGVAFAYSSIASIYAEQGKDEFALEYFLRSLNIHLNAKNNYGAVNSYLNLGKFYLKKDPERAIYFLQKSLELAEKFKFSEYKKDAAYLASKAYNSLKQYKLAYDFCEIAKQIEDTMEVTGNIKLITQMEMQYDFEKKQHNYNIDRQKGELIRELELNKEKTQKNLLVVLVIILLLFSFVGYWLYNIKNKANKALLEQTAYMNLQKVAIEEKSEELQRQKLEILLQHEIIEKQRDLATKQHDQIFKQKQEITDSIYYASRIQAAMLTPAIFINALFNEYFIINKPKDIVSGDFYWMAYHNNKVIIAVADCTGHGIPAAFMSMLGITLLRNIVTRLEAVLANHILNELRERLIRLLHQTGKIGSSQDGMDIALCVIDYENSKMQYAGANLPVYYIRKLSEYEQPDIIKFRPDKMPVGIHTLDESSFTNHEIRISGGDILYMLSDGYIDQFGGAEGKKFMSRNLKNLLWDIYEKPMNEQKEILVGIFDNWKGELYEQVDDILFLGIKI